ncbi:unnamed protein product [Effrenium voratum]|nr:unnamed protein product [Effrenium voratum]
MDFVHPQCATASDDLLQAAESGNTPVVEELLEEPQDPNSAGRDGLLTPLHGSSKYGHLQVVRCLLEVCVDSDIKSDRNGGTPLHFASAHGHLEVVHCLLEAGANKDKASNSGITPLHLAAF